MIVDKMAANESELHEHVRERYAKAVQGAASEPLGCCDSGYSVEELSRIPGGSFLGLGSGNPVRLAALHANAKEDARFLLEEASARLEPVETVFSEVSPVVGTHAGPGTVGLCFIAGM